MFKPGHRAKAKFCGSGGGLLYNAIKNKAHTLIKQGVGLAWLIKIGYTRRDRRYPHTKFSE